MPPFPYGDGAVMEMTITSYTTIVIGLEDTLYDVGAGLTSHVYGEVLLDYMVQTLGFANQAAAKVVRDLYGTRQTSRTGTTPTTTTPTSLHRQRRSASRRRDSSPRSVATRAAWSS